MMAAAAGSSAREELNVSPAAQPRRGAPAGPTPTLLHDTALHSATNIAAAASTTPITPESLAATLHSCISSPTGTKLAVTTPSESPAGGEGARITLDEEKQIALSQLQELEVAIKVRKVTKVDGRKIRWIEYRARKQAEEEKQSGNSKKRPRRSRSKTKGVENNENEANVNNNNNNNSSGNSNNNKNNNNNNKDNINNNNSNKIESTMKVEPVSPPITTVGTSNVLESMKQQFLQGTENIEEPVVNGKSNILAESSLAGQKRKSGRTRKSAGTSEGGSPTSTSPKKLSPSDISPKGANSRTGGASKANSTASSPLFDTSLALSSTPTTPLTSDHPLAIGIKKNFFSPRSLTKGLREIRKMENGSDGVITIKTEETTPVSSPSASLHLTTLASAVSDADAVVPENKTPPDPKPQPAETKSSKAACPLIKAAAKLMSQPTAKAKSSDKSAAKSKKSSSQKGSAKKVSAKSGVKLGSEPSTVINGHTPMVQNGSEEVSLLPSPAVVSALGGAGSKPGSREGSPRTPYDSDSGARKSRGRPPKRVTVKEGTTGTATEKSSKKLATLVVDVHNTMNGEPQTVIPISRPVLRRKRTSSNKSPKKKVLRKNALDPTGSPDIKSSPAPSPKRQKSSESKSQSSSTTSDTKKGKTNKKNNDKPIVTKEEKDNTSASSVNQTQGPPTHTQSTKLTKSVQRAANKAAAPGIEPNTANTNNPPQKKKKVKKPVLKVKTLPAKHKEVSKIVKKSKKVTSIAASKQKKAQPKKSNTIRKYLSTHKGKTVPKGNSNKKEGSQTGPKSSGGEGEGQDPDVICVKQEEDCSTNHLEGGQPQEKDASQQTDSSMLKADTTEMEVEQDFLPQKSMEPMEIEDSKDKASQASEVPCAASLVGPEAALGEEPEAEVKPCITDVVPHNETETQTLMDKSSTAVNILGVDQPYEKVSDLPKISFQNNNNINNNNSEEDGVIISDKEITMVKDLSAEKLSTSSDDIKCITSADSDTKPSENVGEGFDMHENVRDEEPQSQSVSENLQVEEISEQQNSFENEVPSEMDVKAEEDVSDRSKSYSEDMPDIVTLDSSQGNSTYEENMLSGSSLSGMHEENEMPVLEPVSCLPSIPSPSLPERAAPITTLPMVMDELKEEQVLGCDKLSQSVPDLEEQTTLTNDTQTDAANHTSDIVDAKETYPIQDGEVIQTSEVNQTHQFTEPSDCEVQEVQVVGIQTDTLKEDGSDSVLPVSQKSTLKPVKKKEGSVYRKKVKKGLIQGHNITQLQQRQPEVQEEIEITKVTKAQETSQAGVEEACESREVLDVLPSSQKENVEVHDLIAEAQPASLALAPEAHSSSATKTKDKVPRILKQLFQDEGVQNMLKSMSEDPTSVPETSPNSDSGMHKLRPKRITEPMLSSSPELDAMEALFTSSRKKKRGSELDTLYMDEGGLNLLTSKEHNSRRGHQEDAASDISQASSSKSLKVSKTIKPADVSSDTRKRKLSGASTASNASSSSKSLLPPEPKKVRLDAQGTAQDPYEVDAAEEFKEKPVITGYTNLETASNIAKKKTLPVVPLSVKQKNKAIRMQLKLQKQKQLKSTVSEPNESRQDSRSMVEMSSTPKGPVEVYTGASSLPVSFDSSKSVPPIKIKLASDSVTIKPVLRPILPQQPPEVTIVPKPPVRLPIKPQVVESPSPPVHRAIPLPQVRTSPEKPKPHPDHQSPPSQLRRVESFAGPVPPVPGFPSLVRNCDPAAAAAAVAAAAAAAASKSRQRVGGESVRQSQRASVRQSEANYHFRDIALRKFNNFTQIILSPSTTKMKNALNSRVLRELCEALNTLKRDDSVRIVLLTGTGSTFCQGVDLTALQHPNLETRKKNAENLVRGIKDFLKALVQFPKPIIAGVNGNAMGLGVTMLPLFDMVIANDKAEFCLPYAKLGQVPEGGATYTFPNLCGKLQSTQLFLGHKLTARRAQEMGLVSESIWPATYQQELIPKVALLATHSAQSMEATKALMNHHLVTKLELSLESECRLLLQQWTSPHFAHLCKRFLDTQYIHLQKPVSLPL